MKILIIILAIAFTVSVQASPKLTKGYYKFVKMESTIPSELDEVYDTGMKYCAFKISRTWGGSLKVALIDGDKDNFCSLNRNSRKFERRKGYSNIYEYGWERIIVNDSNTFKYLYTNSYTEIYFTFQRVEEKPAKATLIQDWSFYDCELNKGKFCDIDGKMIPFDEVTKEMIENSSYCEKAIAKASIKATEKCQEIYPDKTCEFESAKTNIMVNFKWMMGEKSYCEARAFVRAK